VRGFRDAGSEHDKYFRCRVDRFSASVTCSDSAEHDGDSEADSEHGKIVEVAPTDFLTLHVAIQFCTHSFVLIFSVGLKQYQFENHISSDSDY
jgi:hypothetical protein